MTEGTDESLAKALGCNLIYGRFKCGKQATWPNDNPVLEYHMHTMECEPRWSESFDACLRDIVPVLRERGLTFTIEDDDEGDIFRVKIWPWDEGRRDAWKADGVSLPAAFCEAALQALEATKPTAVAH